MREEKAFRITLEALEHGLRVGDIATRRPACCSSRARAADVLRRVDLAEFDQIPVTRSRSIIGMLERPGEVDGVGNSVSAAAVMRPIDGSLLVAADMALPKFIPLLLDRPYYLVVDDHRIDGIVTRSDLLKMPVRVLAFTLIAHLESRLTAFIRSIARDRSDWLPLLPMDRQRVTAERASQLAKDGLDPDWLELTLFSEKTWMLRKLAEITEEQDEELQLIQNMRNSVVHDRDFANNKDELALFIRTLQLTERWIANLSTSRPTAVRVVTVQPEQATT